MEKHVLVTNISGEPSQSMQSISNSLFGLSNSTIQFLFLFCREKSAKSEYWIRSIRKNNFIAAIAANKGMLFFCCNVQPNCPMKSLIRKLLSPLPYCGKSHRKRFCLYFWWKVLAVINFFQYIQNSLEYFWNPWNSDKNVVP